MLVSYFARHGVHPTRLFLSNKVRAATAYRINLNRFQTNSKHDTSSTVDTKNVELYSNLASIWWLPEGPITPLRFFNTLRVPFVRDGLLSANHISADRINSAQALENFKILDVGCAGGFLTEDLARLHAIVTGLDASPELIQAARNHIRDFSPELSDRINYKVGSIENHVKENREGYDAVVLSEVIEHVENVEQFLEACVQATKPGGVLFITTPNRTIRSFSYWIILAEYILGKIPKGTHDWKKFIRPHEMQKMLQKHNCRTNLVKGMIYNYPKKQWKWIESESVWYALSAIKDKSQ